MDWRNPTPTVDVIVVRRDPTVQILLIERLNAPHGWALPGGFVDEGERVESAAVREVREETCLCPTLCTLLYVYSDPSRDPRKHTVSIVFIGEVDGKQVAQAADDACSVRWVDRQALETCLAHSRPRLDDKPFAFDHAEILRDWLRFETDGIRPLFVP